MGDVNQWPRVLKDATHEYFPYGIKGVHVLQMYIQFDWFSKVFLANEPTVHAVLKMLFLGIISKIIKGKM